MEAGEECIRDIENIGYTVHVDEKEPESQTVYFLEVKTAVYEAVKRLLDIVFSFIGIILLSPVFLAVAVLIVCKDGSSPIYVQMRVKKGGRLFKLYKFRSMIVTDKPLEELLTRDELEYYRKEFKLEHDPRVTKFGKFLRKTSIDELPQLWNILRGDLSVVGPRPVTQEETKFYGEDRNLFLSVKPGLTGYWQVYARNGADYESGKRQEMELYYVKNRSFLLDIKVFVKTFEAVWRKTGV